MSRTKWVFDDKGGTETRPFEQWKRVDEEPAEESAPEEDED